jgi:hypothetical protein
MKQLFFLQFCLNNNYYKQKVQKVHTKTCTSQKQILTFENLEE